jgi:hypothetical protein
VSSPWHHFYEFWVGQQTVPGNILGDVLIGAATLIIGKYKVAPWLRARHREHMDQKERHHQEVMQAHHDLYDLHDRQYQLLLTQSAPDGSAPPPSAEPPSAEPRSAQAVPAPASPAPAPPTMASDWAGGVLDEAAQAQVADSGDHAAAQ